MFGFDTCSIPGENKFWDSEESSLKAIQSRLTNVEITQLTFLKQEDIIGIT